MEFNIKANSTAEVSEKCTENNTAIKLGSGKSPVYATPALVALMENAAINACDPQLPEGYNTVGIAMNVKHVAATPIGLTVTAKATLVEQDRKTLTFKIEAHDEAGLVGEATHDRFIIESAPFLAKAEAKKAAAK